MNKPVDKEQKIIPASWHRAHHASVRRLLNTGAYILIYYIENAGEDGNRVTFVREGARPDYLYKVRELARAIADRDCLPVTIYAVYRRVSLLDKDNYMATDTTYISMVIQPESIRDERARAGERSIALYQPHLLKKFSYLRVDGVSK